MQTFKVSDGDFIFAYNKPLIVTDLSKLGQLIYEIFSIETQENGFGASLSKINDIDISILLRTSLDRYLNMQNSSTYKRTDSETLKAITNIKTEQHGTTVAFLVDLMSKDGEQFSVTDIIQ